MKHRVKVVLALAFSGLLMANEGGCENQPSSVLQQHQAQEQLSQRSNMAAGMPAITRFSEKKILKDILELRDQMPATWTYLFDMNGHVGDLVCHSVGYAFSGATQYTNPQQTVYGSGRDSITTLPQADPNGLYSPAQEDGTWVLCKDPTPGSTKLWPVRVEPKVISSPFPLKGEK